VEAPSWYSVTAPAATPADIVGKLHAEIVTINAQPDYRATLSKQALEPHTTTSEEFAAFLKVEYEKWGKIIKSLKLQ
jgi:tripartite-type tricarboxylate transporter receptor subunit TctC